jgi:zinc/manganese transport system permease protein
MLISTNSEEAYRRRWWVRWWDFLFYFSFGVMITFSVEIGGILMVFAYLVIPACVAILLHAGMRWRLFIGWIVGVVGSGLGLAASYYFDLPTGPAIVVILGLLLAVAWLFDMASGRR